jgi:BirA family biotin operon repressor/biotin-[acetyl-CoA-carboxylase] ligase
MSTAATPFDRSLFAALAPELAGGLLWLEETASTNDEAAKLGRQGAPEGTMVGAERQSHGRGRRGAPWHLGPGDGLAFSLLLRPDFARPLWPRLALAAGLAVCQVVERAGLAGAIKWPNDVLVGGRKIAGILVEAAANFVVVGIGINVNGLDFPDELSAIATSIEQQSGRRWDREWVLAETLRGVLLGAADCGAEFPAVINAVRSRCALTGNQIRYTAGGQTHSGQAVGLGDAGELLVRENGLLVRCVQADEVRLVG